MVRSMSAIPSADAPEDRSVAVRRWTIALAALSVAIFLRALSNGFIEYDDSEYVYGNPHVRGGLSLQGVRWALSAFYSANWHPLTWLSHMADWQLWGDQAAGHHLTNVLLHAMNAVLLFRFLLLATGAPHRSGIVATLFAVHPLRVESVAWIAERKDLLSAAFMFLGLLLYVRWTRRQTGFGWVVASFTFALASKPSAISFPLLLLMLDAWPLHRWTRETTWARLREKWVLAPLMVASAVLTILAQRSAGAIRSTEYVPVWERLANACVAYVRYLGKTAYPAALAIPYPLDRATLTTMVVAGALGLLLAISLTAVLLRRKWPALAMGWCWFLVVLVPMIGVIQVGAQALADRYTYVSQIGLWIALAFVPWAPSRAALRWAIAGLVSTVLALCALTFRQIGYWQDVQTLFSHTLDVAPENNLVPTMAKGEDALRNGRLDEAARWFERALAMAPLYAGAISDLGTVRVKQGRLAEALALLERAHAMEPEDVGTGVNLGIALVKAGRFGEAVPLYRQLYAHEPRHPGIAAELGFLLGQTGHRKEALKVLSEAVSIDPGSPHAHFNLGVALARDGQFSQALAEFQRVAELAPDFPGIGQAIQNAREDAAGN